ncbi:PREDICTED: SKP1-like protein 15 [Camelina sativa]|uniref:SKP1-like protein 15 n=1 Tax=Camelina sativa TaxID=90675 RepID=A0ABM0YWK3_CAMSA|nr:PREDICTED: SKP1-like protein 15 [Camelina sativa]
MSSKKIVLTSSDGESFEVEEAVAREMQIVRHIIEDGCATNAIPLLNVTGMILAMVIEYCKRHVDDDHVATEDAKKKLKDWDEEFMKNLDVDTIISLVVAADYIHV